MGDQEHGMMNGCPKKLRQVLRDVNKNGDISLPATVRRLVSISYRFTVNNL